MSAMTSVLAIVSLPFSAAHHLCRHFISPPRFMFCFSERMLSAIPFFLLFAPSRSLYVLADDVLSSPFTPHFLVLGHSPFPSSRLYTLSVESLSPSADRDSFIHRESSHRPLLKKCTESDRRLPIRNYQFVSRRILVLSFPTSNVAE